jgi:homoserine kinase
MAREDKMHQNLRMNGMRELYKVQKVALLNGALMSTLSGSGSSFFNLAYEDDAKIMQEKLKNTFPRFRVEVFNFDNNGYLIEK